MILVELAGRDETGLRLVAAPGRLPPGGRRAGLLAHAYRPQLIGLSTRIFTGWLEFSADGGAVYAPHTARGFIALPRKKADLATQADVQRRPGQLAGVSGDGGRHQAARRCRWRGDGGEPFLPGQAPGIATILAAYTSGSARVNGLEGVTGLRPGRS